MPPTNYEPAELKRLEDLICPSVVTVSKFGRECGHADFEFNFRTGFIVFSDKDETYICVNKSILTDGDEIYVDFNDGESGKADVFLRDSLSDHAVLVVPNTSGRSQPAVTFCTSAAKRGPIVVAAEVRRPEGLNNMTGTVLNPDCTRILSSNKVVDGSKLFALSCPAVAKGDHWTDNQKQVIGCAVFDFSGLVIGTISSFDGDVDAYDLKYARHSYLWVDGLENVLKSKKEKILLQRQVASAHN